MEIRAVKGSVAALHIGPPIINHMWETMFYYGTLEPGYSGL